MTDNARGSEPAYVTQVEQRDPQRYVTPAAKIAALRATYSVHDLKVAQPFYAPLSLGIKTFEVRRDDRDFQPGDVLILREWDGEDYTGKEYVRVTDYVMRDGERWGIMPGYVVLSLRAITATDLAR